MGKVLLTVFLLLLVAGGYLGIRLYTSILKDAPDISKIDVTPSGYATFVYDDEGKQTAKLVAADSNRIPVTIDQVPKDLQPDSTSITAWMSSALYARAGKE